MSEKLKVEFRSAAGSVSLPQAEWVSVVNSAGDVVWTSPAAGGLTGVNRQFALFGVAALVRETLRKSPADPAAELAARFAKISDSTWGDEKLPRAKKPPRDPLAELVDVIRAVKEAKGLVFVESETRAKLADPEWKRRARKEPHVAAELARRKAAAAQNTEASPSAAVDSL